MKVIFKNSNLVFEKNAQKVPLSAYDAFGASDMGDTGNLPSVNASASDKRVKMYNVSEFAGKKLNIKLYWALSPSSYTDKYCVAFYTTAKTHEDVNGSNILIADNGYLSTSGMTKKWNWAQDVPAASCEITAEIDIPAGTVAMAIQAGLAQYSAVSYPDNSEAYYIE